MIGKRIISGITCAAMLLSMSSLLSGCNWDKPDPDAGQNNVPANVPVDDENVTPVSDGVLTNGEWLAMVNDAFGMQVDESSEDGELEAARAWGVIGQGETIDVNAPVDDMFVTSTLMRASGYADLDSTDEEIINAAIAHGVITKDSMTVAQPMQAASSLAAAQDAWSHQTFEEYQNIELADNVVNLTDGMSTADYQISDEAVVIPSELAGGIAEETVFILPKDEATGEGGAYKTVSVIDNGDGTTSIKCMPAGVEDVYKHIQVSGAYGIDENQSESLRDDVEVVVGVADDRKDTSAGIQPLGFANKDAGMQQLGSVSAKPISYKMDLGDGFSVTATLKDVVLNTDIDWDFTWRHGLEVNKIFMTVDYTTDVTFESKDFEFNAEASMEKALEKKFVSKPSLDIGKLSVPINGAIKVNLTVTLTLEASGKIKVSVTTQNTKGFEMKGKNFRAINDSHTSEEIVITGEVGAYLSLKLSLNLSYLIGNTDLVTLELKVGPTLQAEIVIHNEEGTENDMLCIDADGYLTVVVKVYLLQDLMKILKIDSTITLVECNDYDSSPVKFHVHLENFKRTAGDVCTFEEKTTEAPTEPETIPVGIFALEQSYLSLDVGSSAKIAVKSLPSGYSASDIVWRSSDPSKVSIDADGNVTALAAGSVGITAVIGDNEYTVSCAINAKAAPVWNVVTYGRYENMAA